jgi:clathrin heavy chain
MWKDCIDTANESADSEILEKLLRFFCEPSEKECFCAALYTCYAHISPDVALELGWINGYHNFVMPFLIQTFKHTHDRLKKLEVKTNPKEEENAENEIAGSYGGLNGFNNGMLMLGNGGQSMAEVPQQMNGGLDMSGFGVSNGVPQQGMPGY